MANEFSYKVKTKLSKDRLGRTGVIKTPHGSIQTPAFIVVGTKATVKAMTPEQVEGANAQAVLANAYHLYLQPGHKLIEEAGGLGKFMNWNHPTFTDSGGFQVLSLGSGFKKVIDMVGGEAEDISKPKKAERKAFVDNDGVNFYSHLDGSKHRFTAELSMQIQHALGSDIMFAFDELTSLLDTYDYQIESLDRTEAWAKRCLGEISQLRLKHPDRPYQALFGVVQGAQYQELPENKPRHLLGISEPDDIFAAIENGVDTFDCVSPTRVGRNGSAYTYFGRKNIVASKYRRDFGPIIEDCECYTCMNYTCAYLHHLLHAHELLANTLMSIHNEHFIIKLVDDIRLSIENDSFDELKIKWLKNYYSK
jgi:queuine tRNA-ribosyltransferase